MIAPRDTLESGIKVNAPIMLGGRDSCASNLLHMRTCGTPCGCQVPDASLQIWWPYNSCTIYLF